MKNKLHIPTIIRLGLAAVFVILTALLVIGAVRYKFAADSFYKPIETLDRFTYEIAGGENGAASFPHSFSDLAPNTAVTVYADVEPGRYANLLIKTVYTKLRLYADDILIYECGQPGTYPAWLTSPPTLLKIVPLPDTASHLRFEYISPSQRNTMNLPAITAGSDGALLAELFGKNAVILAVSVFLLILGFAVTVISLVYRRGTGPSGGGMVFLHLGAFALAVCCWSFGECNATAFLIPYPVLLYLAAFGGLFTLSIPLLRYGLHILSPKNPFAMRLTIAVTEAAVLLAFALQLAGLVSLSKSMYLFHILIPFGLAVFAATSIYEHFRYHNPTAKQFTLPALVLALAAVMEVVNYSLRFTHILSLFFLLGALIFTLMLGVIGILYAVETRRAFEEAAEKNDFYHRMAHDILTPLTRVSTNIQVANMKPEKSPELLTEAQTDIMLMADMVNDALRGEGDL